MSLINDKQRDNAQQKKPTAKPIKVSSPQQLEVGTVGTGNEFQPAGDLGAAPELQEPSFVQEQQPSAPPVESAADFNLTQPVTSKAFVPQNPLESVGSTPINVWEKLADGQSPYSPEILSTRKPTVYDSSTVTSDAAALNRVGFASVRGSLQTYDKRKQEAAQAEQAYQQRLNTRSENVNIPRQSQPWGGMVGQAFNDLLFGSKQAQEEAEKQGVVNPFRLQYGRQGAGVGGWLKYVLGTPLNASIGAVADLNQATVNVLKTAGVSDEAAKRFATGGVLGLAMDATLGKKKTDEVFKAIRPQQDWSKTQGRSALLDAITHGEQYGDINDPKGNSKGVFYRAARPRRSQQETEAARLGKADVFNVGGIGQAIKDDPVGAGYEILVNVLDPAGNKLGDLVMEGMRGLSRTSKVAGNTTKAETAAVKKAQQQQLLLPPGKVKSIPVDDQLRELFGNKIPKPPAPQALIAPAQELPKLPYSTPKEGFPRINLGEGIPVTGTRVITPDAGKLPASATSAGATRRTPHKFISFPSDAEELSKVERQLDPWSASSVDADSTIPTTHRTAATENEPVRMGATLENAAESGLPKLKPGAFQPENIEDFWLNDSVGVIDAKFEPITTAAANPTKVPRVYNGDFRVTQKALPPALDNVGKLAFEDVVGTPSEVALKVGIGKPSSEPIKFADEINIQGVDAPIVDEPPSAPEAPATKPTKQPERVEWKTREDQPLNKITWVKDGLSNGSVRRIDPQKLDKLWTFDRVEKQGIGGIGNRYEEATRFLQKNNVEGGTGIKMPEIVVRSDGSVNFVDGRHRFATLRDLGFTEIPVVVRGAKYLPDEVRTLTKAASEITPKATVDTLEQAAEQLAMHKAVIQAPLQQLDNLFDTVVDFGRRQIDEMPFSEMTPDGIYDALVNQAKLNLPKLAEKVIAKNYGDDIAQALVHADYHTLEDLLSKGSVDLQKFVSDVSEINNGLVNAKIPGQALVGKIEGNKVSLANTIKFPSKVLHGTALADWSPNYSLRVSGSRGELGSGLYVTNRMSVAEDYAGSILSENVNPGANVKDIAPSVYELTHNLGSTFSARGKLAPSSPLVKSIVSSLPEKIQDNVRISINRDKSTSLVGILNKAEAALVRSSIEPTEQVLKDLSSNVSEALRQLGYDSVYDSKSGFGLVLDESKIKINKSKPVSKPTSATQAALARYNADAYAAKFYPERLTTDANLRDSAYKLLSQMEDKVDGKLAEVQQEIIKRGLDKQQTVLPPKNSLKKGVSMNDSKPAKVDELMDSIEPKSTNPCEF